MFYTAKILGFWNSPSDHEIGALGGGHSGVVFVLYLVRTVYRQPAAHDARDRQTSRDKATRDDQPRRRSIRQKPAGFKSRQSSKASRPQKPPSHQTPSLKSHETSGHADTCKRSQRTKNNVFWSTRNAYYFRCAQKSLSSSKHAHLGSGTMRETFFFDYVS